MNNLIIKFLIQLKNTAAINKEFFFIPFNKMILQILECLYKEGFIQSFVVINNYIKIFLRYYFNKNVFKNLKLISIPSRLIFIQYNNLVKILNRYRFILISTSKGIKTFEECKRLHLGGKILFLC